MGEPFARTIAAAGLHAGPQHVAEMLEAPIRRRIATWLDSLEHVPHLGNHPCQHTLRRRTKMILQEIQISN